jgi:uncharacterized membrane protein (UPF0127 family)
MVAFSLLVFTSCDNPPPSSIATANMRLGNENFVVEIANTDPVREHGLMQRDSMPPNHGMIFVFPIERPQAFWMKNTRFPLDIIYIDGAGKVDSVKQMKAYDLTSVPSNGAIKYAIELNLGRAAEIGVKEGDHIDIPPEAKESKDPKE